MAYKTLTKKELALSIYKKLGFSKEESKRFVHHIINNIEEKLISGKSVKISSLGTFLVRLKKERLGRNPKTGIEAKITSRKVVTFKFSDKLKKQINLD